jgi:SAM-dependent methyltransferase
MPWLPYLGMPHLVQRLLDLLPDIRGKRVLDLGTGTGFLAVLLALHGARVVAIDVSENQLELARLRARISGVEDAIDFRHASTDVLDWPDGSFAAVVGSFILHHVDLATTGREIRRVLAPRGKGVFIETSARNQLLMACRHYLVGKFGIPRAGTDDEKPLDRHAEDSLVHFFPRGVRYHYPDVVFLRMAPAYIGLVRRAPFMWLMKTLDRAILRVPALRRYSYFVVVELDSAPPGR